MTTEAQVRSAPNAAEAMAVLARKLDEIGAQIAEIRSAPAADDYLAWPGQTFAEPPTPPAQPTTQGVQDLLRQIDEALQNESDPEERAALEARKRLLLDTGEAVVTELPDSGVRPEIEVTENGVTVTVPPVSQERKDARRALALKWKLGEWFTALTDEEAADAYAKGGPMWLYTYDRKSVIDMPRGWRVAMIDDVEQDNVAAAQELARDLLKDRGHGDPMDVQLERQEQLR